jgi:hypothetical protein
VRGDILLEKRLSLLALQGAVAGFESLGFGT